MKRSIFITAALVSSIVFSGAALARTTQSDSEGDMLYGNGLVAASPSDAFHYMGPVQNGREGDLLYSRNRPEPTVAYQGYQRLADDRDSSTDQVYGSQLLVGQQAQQGLVGSCTVNQAVC